MSVRIRVCSAVTRPPDPNLVPNPQRSGSGDSMPPHTALTVASSRGMSIFAVTFSGARILRIRRLCQGDVGRIRKTVRLS